MSETNIKKNRENPVVNFLKKFISFEHMITPNIITIIFWVLVTGVTLSGLATIIAAFSGYGVNQWLVIYGLIYMVIGILITKVFCEILMVLFKINDNLKEIVENTRK